MSEAGKIGDRDRYNQPIDFSGMRYKNITPSDMDGRIYFFEIHKMIFIFIELKYNGTPCEGGQRWAFQNLVDVITVPSIYIIADHYVHSKSQEIPANYCIIREYYVRGKWHPPKNKGTTLKYGVDTFLTRHGFQDYVKYIPES